MEFKVSLLSRIPIGQDGFAPSDCFLSLEKCLINNVRLKAYTAYTRSSVSKPLMDNAGSQVLFCAKTNHVFANTEFVLLSVPVLLYY